MTMPAVILSSPSISDGTGSGFIVVVDRTPLRMAVAICTRRAAYAWSLSKSWRLRDDAARPDRDGRLRRCGVPGLYARWSCSLRLCDASHCIAGEKKHPSPLDFDVGRLGNYSGREIRIRRIANHVRMVELGSSAASLSNGSAECRSGGTPLAELPAGEGLVERGVELFRPKRLAKQLEPMLHRGSRKS